MGLLKEGSYRSVSTGNWRLDKWPNYALNGNPWIKLTDDQLCPASAEEVENAKRYVAEIGGAVILT